MGRNRQWRRVAAKKRSHNRSSSIAPKDDLKSQDDGNRYSLRETHGHLGASHGIRAQSERLPGTMSGARSMSPSLSQARSGLPLIRSQSTRSSPATSTTLSSKSRSQSGKRSPPPIPIPLGRPHSLQSNSGGQLPEALSLSERENLSSGNTKEGKGLRLGAPSGARGARAQSPAYVNSARPKSSTEIPPLHRACGHGQIAMIESLLDRNNDVDSRTAKLATPLHFAASFGHVDVVRLLLDRGADVNVYDSDRGTPLHDACQGGHTEAALQLLLSGANSSACDQGGETAIDLAEAMGHFQTANAVREAIALAGHRGGTESNKLSSGLRTSQRSKISDGESTLAASSKASTSLMSDLQDDTGGVAVFTRPRSQDFFQQHVPLMRQAYPPSRRSRPSPINHVRLMLYRMTFLISSTLLTIKTARTRSAVLSTASALLGDNVSFCEESTCLSHGQRKYYVDNILDIVVERPIFSLESMCCQKGHLILYIDHSRRAAANQNSSRNGLLSSGISSASYKTEDSKLLMSSRGMDSSRYSEGDGQGRLSAVRDVSQSRPSGGFKQPMAADGSSLDCSPVPMNDSSEPAYDVIKLRHVRGVLDVFDEFVPRIRDARCRRHGLPLVDPTKVEQEVFYESSGDVFCAQALRCFCFTETSMNREYVEHTHCSMCCYRVTRQVDIHSITQVDVHRSEIQKCCSGTASFALATGQAQPWAGTLNIRSVGEFERVLDELSETLVSTLTEYDDGPPHSPVWGEAPMVR